MWLCIYVMNLCKSHISTHTSRVGCDGYVSVHPCEFIISTHTSRVGCDFDAFFYLCCVLISTHTSRVGCDQVWKDLWSDKIIFLLTHPVWDVTCFLLTLSRMSHTFLLTHPVWDVTTNWQTQLKTSTFLLTHPVWDVTEIKREVNTLISDFYSHIPCGMWPVVPQLVDQCRGISTHTSRVGCDAFRHRACPVIFISTHTSRVGCDYSGGHRNAVGYKFLLTHPVWDVTTYYFPRSMLLGISTHTSRVGCDL